MDCTEIRANNLIDNSNQRKLQAKSQRAPAGMLAARPLLRIALPIINAVLPAPRRYSG